jgi:hypothetical protein
MPETTNCNELSREVAATFGLAKPILIPIGNTNSQLGLRTLAQLMNCSTYSASTVRESGSSIL